MFRKLPIVAVVLTLIAQGFFASGASAAQCSPGPGLNLTGCDFSNQDLYGANFAGSSLQGANFGSSNLEFSKFTDAILIDASFNGADLGSADLTRADLTQATFVNSVLWGTTFVNANLAGAVFNIDVYACDFTGANLSNSTFTMKMQGNFTNANLSGAELQLTIGPSNFEGANLQYADINHAWWGRSNMKGADLRHANFLYAYLAETDLREADLSDSYLNNGVFALANLTNAKLVNTDLGEGNFRGADFTGANLYGIKGTMTSLPFSIDFPPILPVGWKVIYRHLVGPGANLSGVSMSGIDWEAMSAMDLHGSNFTDAFWVRGSDLSGANVEGAEQVCGAKGNGIIGTPKSMCIGERLVNGWIVGPTAKDLAGADLSNSDLSGLRLVATNLRGANLEGANLTNTELYYSDLTGANLKGAILEKTSFDQTILEGLKSGSISGVPINLPPGFVLRDGVLGHTYPGPDPVPGVSGIARPGQLLTSTSGNWLTGVSINIQWLKDGVAIPGATGSSYLTTADDVRHQISVAVTGNLDGYCPLTQRSAALEIVPSTITPKYSWISGTSKVGQTLRANIGNWAQGVSVSTQWLRDGAQISGATGTTYQLLPSDAGHQIGLQTTGSAAGFSSVVLTTSSTVVENGTLTSTPNPDISGVFAVGSLLTAQIGSWDPGVTVSTQWLRDGTPIRDAVRESYTLTLGDSGHQISVQTTGSSLGYTSVVAYSAARVAAGLTMRVVAPKISGIVKVGQSLKVSSAQWASGSAATYEWLLDGKTIKGATKSSYKLLATQKGHKISVKVTQTATGYVAASATSLATKVG